MTSIPDPRLQHRSRRLSELPKCGWCGDPVRISSRRPHQYCSDLCRQRAHRAAIRDAAEKSKATINGEFRDTSKSTDPSAIEAPICHLLGSGTRWQGGIGRLDRALVAKIIRSELGDGELVTSTDGIVSTVIKPGRKAAISTNNFRNTPRLIRPTAADGTGDVTNVAASELADIWRNRMLDNTTESPELQSRQIPDINTIAAWWREASFGDRVELVHAIGVANVWDALSEAIN